MSQYGIKIKNYEAASIYEYQYGFRSSLDQTEAMLVNSLFLDFLLDNNLIKIWKNDSTRDIVCVEFGYGTKTYDKAIKKIGDTLNITDLKDESKIALNKIKSNIEKNKEKCIQITKEDLRVKFYTEGFQMKPDKGTGRRQAKSSFIRK